MEQTLAEIWESSRSNQYSWLLSTVLAVGGLGLVSLSWIRRNAPRRALKIILTIALSCCAVEASAMQIVEKWRIRQQWGAMHKDELSDSDRSALTADGANFVMGPLINGGGYSVFVFGISLVASSIMVRKIQAKRKDSQKVGPPNG